MWSVTGRRGSKIGRAKGRCGEDACTYQTCICVAQESRLSGSGHGYRFWGRSWSYDQPEGVRTSSRISHGILSNLFSCCSMLYAEVGPESTLQNRAEATNRWFPRIVTGCLSGTRAWGVGFGIGQVYYGARAPEDSLEAGVPGVSDHFRSPARSTRSCCSRSTVSPQGFARERNKTPRAGDLAHASGADQRPLA